MSSFKKGSESLSVILEGVKEVLESPATVPSLRYDDEDHFINFYRWQKATQKVSGATSAKNLSEYEMVL